MSLSIQLVVKNNEKTITKTLESILHLNSKILVADIGCRDNTTRICKKYDAQVVKLSLDNDYSQVRNHLIKTCNEDWILFIEPWEYVMRGSISDLLKSPKTYRFNVLQGNVLTKEVRLWHRSKNLKFTNPVYETVFDDSAENTSIYLHSLGRQEDDNLDLVKNWRKRSPLAVEPIYYEACTLLLQKKWKDFLNIANHYIYLEKKRKMSLTMCQYYCAMVLCYVNKDYQQALKHIISCIAEKPTMAEYWCLLGDIYYTAKQYNKAIIFYENALIIGSRRLKNDDWPFEIDKYKEYPEKMIKACDELINKSTFYHSKVHM